MRSPSNSRLQSYGGFAEAVAFLGDVNAPKTERVSRLLSLLQSGLGPELREQIASLFLDLVQIERLVPDVYQQWRPVVRDALRFVFLRMSASRLAPKLVEQFELPADATREARLLRFIARMPGFQKLGQILARNQHLNPSLREELIKLENSIADADVVEINAIVSEKLGSRIQTYEVTVAPELLSEATVSAVLRFTWRNPESSEKERGVFKVLKPYIPACFAEDMELFQQVAEHLASRHEEYSLASNVLLETFEEVRCLLEREVDFAQEQKALQVVSEMYGAVAGVRTPRLIAPLCAPQCTAMTEESGVKITEAAEEMPGWRRQRLASQVVACLIGTPLFSRQNEALFHADPHAGNLFYDKETGELIVLDWALTERLTHLQRRHFSLLFMLLALRDADGVCREIHALSGTECNGGHARTVRRCVVRFLGQLPWTALPGLMDVTRLLDTLALEGIGFPAPLLMFRKVLFTLDGILHEIAGPQFSIAFALASYFAERLMAKGDTPDLPLLASDWLAVQWSSLFYGSRLWGQLMGAFV